MIQTVTDDDALLRIPGKDNQPVEFPLEHDYPRFDPVHKDTMLPVDMEDAIDLREQRLIHAEEGFEDIKPDEIQAAEMELCRQSLLYWINNYVWTFVIRKHGEDGKVINQLNLEIDIDDAETRKNKLAHIPFITWPIQDWALEKVLFCIGTGRDLIIDKSRDMGASWMLLVVSIWFWLFHPDFQIGCNSKVEDDVDKTTNPKALFWKIDYLLMHLPSWMLPCPIGKLRKGKANRQHMNLFNPRNGSVIRGSPTTGDKPKGDRVNWLWFDEMAIQDKAMATWEAAADTTACRTGNSTPAGPGTAFTQLRNQGLEEGNIEVISLGYWNHPDKGRGREWVQDEDGKATGTIGRWFYRTPWFMVERFDRGRSLRDIAENVLINHETSGAQFFDTIAISQHRLRYKRDGVRCKLIKLSPDEPEHLPLLKMGHKALFVPNNSDRPQDKAWWWVFVDKDEHGLYTFGTDDNFMIFSDVADGVGASNSTACVLSKGGLEQVAELASPWISSYDLADELCFAGSTVFAGAVGTAFLGWEAGGPGVSFYQHVQRHHYLYCYKRRKLESDHDDPTKQYGWVPTRASKEILLDRLDRTIVRDEIRVRSGPCLSEMLRYVRYDDGSLGPGHLEEELTGARDNHGDRVIALAGCIFLLKEVPRHKAPIPVLVKGSTGEIAGMNEVWGPSPGDGIDEAKEWYNL